MEGLSAVDARERERQFFAGEGLPADKLAVAQLFTGAAYSGKKGVVSLIRKLADVQCSRLQGALESIETQVWLHSLAEPGPDTLASCAVRGMQLCHVPDPEVENGRCWMRRRAFLVRFPDAKLSTYFAMQDSKRWAGRTGCPLHR
jgi:hypothetical protein